MSTSSGLTAFKRKFKGFMCRNEALVLTYHSILPPGTDLFPIPHHLAGEVFGAQMQYLKDEGFNCVSLRKLNQYIETRSLPSRTVAITFDDGFYNNYSVAFPILKKFQIPATIFIAAGFLGGKKLAWPERLALILRLSHQPALQLADLRLTLGSPEKNKAAYTAVARHFSGVTPEGIESALVDLMAQAQLSQEDLYGSELYQALRFMTWDDVRVMAESGLIDFGSHTINHRRLIFLDDRQAAEEIAHSRQLISDHVGDCVAFAYPHGRRDKDFTESHAAMAREAGYRIVVTADAGVVTADSNALDLKRFNILDDSDIDTFDFMMRGGLVFNHLNGRPSIMRGVISGRIST